MAISWEFYSGMKRFLCETCGNELYFETHTCLSCGQSVGYDAGLHDLVPTGPSSDGGRRGLLCANATTIGCNWLVTPEEAASHQGALCRSCSHTLVIPDISSQANLDNWRKLESAKRRIFYSLDRLGLSHPTKQEDAEKGLIFHFLADSTGGDGNTAPILTGHEQGVIVVNIAEANDAVREERRLAMNELYRTLIGHFRHEIGHYYWDRLVADRHAQDMFRAIFGDERQDYDAALARYYGNGPRPDWKLGYVSAYASSHPWEDFAETWAHYLHMIEGIDTARAYSLQLAPRPESETAVALTADFDPYGDRPISSLVDSWIPLTIMANALNRSMGQPDIYPFVITAEVLAKLEFVHDLIRRSQDTRREAATPLRRTA